jgi:hypothetical protein
LKKIANCLGLENANTISTPLNKNVVLSKSQCPSTDEEKEKMQSCPYLVTIGSLMYATMGMQLDITFVVAHLCQFSSNLGTAHWTATQCMVRYLVTTKFHVLMLGGLNALRLVGWVDSDWGSNVDHR